MLSVKAKRRRLYIIAFFLLFVLSSCGTEKDSLIDSSLNKANILELDETAVVKAMHFDRFAVSTICNTNEQIPINRTVDIYGVFFTENDPDIIRAALTNRFSEISMYSNSTCIITANEYTVDSTSIEDGVLFTLHLVADDEPSVSHTYDIGKIEFVYPSGTTVHAEVDAFCLTFYSEEPNKTNIIESPAGSAVAIAQNEFLLVNYLFLSANTAAKNDFSLSFTVPPNIEPSVTASLIDIAKDEKMTETALSELYFELSAEEKNCLNVYCVSVSLTKESTRGVILQLLFNTDILGEQHYMGAFCPLIIQ